ncbi:MAG TPA: hypothetical protein ENL03_01930 [Phycisphaerae bacterium]|nr:hypothetical protein [Phycisphaerae bacterium]
MKMTIRRRLIQVLTIPTVLFALVLPGCLITKGPAVNDGAAVPSPIDLTLPVSIEIHPFTEARTFDNAGGIKGIEMRIKALDADDDTTKAYGDFRVEMYTHNPQASNKLGMKVATWDIKLLDAKDNRRHWHAISRTYKFLLEWDKPIPVGQRYVLQAVFSSPFTDRAVTQRTFVSGE